MATLHYKRPPVLRDHILLTAGVDFDMFHYTFIVVYFNGLGQKDFDKKHFRRILSI